MSVRMKLTFTSPVAEDHDKGFLDGDDGGGGREDNGESLEERKAAFKRDEELMRETSKFVAEVIEAATIEANRRAEQVRDVFFFFHGSTPAGGGDVYI